MKSRLVHLALAGIVLASFVGSIPAKTVKADDPPGSIGEPYTIVDGLIDMMREVYKNDWHHPYEFDCTVELADDDILNEEGNPEIVAYVNRNAANECYILFFPTFVRDYPIEYRERFAVLLAGLSLGVPPNYEQPLSAMNPASIFVNEKRTITERDRTIYNIKWKKGYHVTMPGLSR